jgi:hypothetical protein
MAASSPIEPVVDSPVELEPAFESLAAQSKTRMNWLALVIAVIVLAGVVAGAMAMAGYWGPHGRVEAKLKIAVPQTAVGSDPDRLPDPRVEKRARDNVVAMLKSRRLINQVITRVPQRITGWDQVDDLAAWLDERLYVEERGDQVLAVGLKPLVNPDEDKRIVETLVKCLLETLDSQESSRRASRREMLFKLQEQLSRDIEMLQKDLKAYRPGVNLDVEDGTLTIKLQIARDTMTPLSTELSRGRIALAVVKARAKAANQAESDPKVAEEIASLTAQIMATESELSGLFALEGAIVAHQAETNRIEEKLRPISDR